MTFSGLTKIISFEPFYKVTKAYQVLSARSVQARIQDFEMGGWGVNFCNNVIEPINI